MILAFIAGIFVGIVSTILGFFYWISSDCDQGATKDSIKNEKP